MKKRTKYGSRKVVCRLCFLCQKPMLVFNSRINDGKGKFCSKKCFNEWRRKFGKGTITIKCKQCGKLFIPKIRRLLKRGIFCSHKCHGKFIHNNPKYPKLNRIQLKLSINMRRSISYALKNNKKKRTWESLVGYDVETLIKHLQKRFLSGMTWENYGLWHIDHIIPISAFNFRNFNHIDFKKCWDLKNLQPLWAKENISKSNKLNQPFQPSLAI